MFYKLSILFIAYLPFFLYLVLKSFFFLSTFGNIQRANAVAVICYFSSIKRKTSWSFLCQIIIVGIGEDVDEIELKSIVENADDELFLVGSFLELEPLLRNKKLNDAICLQTSTLKSPHPFCSVCVICLNKFQLKQALATSFQLFFNGKFLALVFPC